MAKGSSSNTETSAFIISNKNLQLKHELINIAAHEGLSLSQFVRRHLIAIRDATPVEKRKPLAKY